MKTDAFPQLLRLVAGSLVIVFSSMPAAGAPAPQSGPITLTADGSLLLKVNPSNDTLALINPATMELSGSVDVGIDPDAVVTVDGLAFVAHRSGISVVNLALKAVIKTLPFRQAELILAPNGTRLFVLRHVPDQFDPEVITVDVATCNVIASEMLELDEDDAEGRLAVSNDGDADDTDEHIYFAVTNGQLRLGKGVMEEGQDDQREGRVEMISASTLAHAATIYIAPLNSTGFPSNGKSAPATSGSSPVPAVASTNPPTASTPTGAFPNQLAAVALHPTNGKGYVCSTAASPNGPQSPSTNHQGLVSVIDIATGLEVSAPQTDPSVCRTAPLNLNQGMDLVTSPVTCRYSSNPIAMVWEHDGSNAWIVNQNTNCVVRLTVDANGIPTRGAPLSAGPGDAVQVDLEVVLPSLMPGKGADGICVNSAGTRAYVSCSISRSVTVVDISNPAAPVIVATTQSAPTPPPGTREAIAHRGEELFHSARGRMSSEGWSSCSSCHPGGLSDNVTWMMRDGPRQTIALNGTFAKDNPADQRILNWSATADEIPDCERKIRDMGGSGLIDGDRSFFAIGGVAGAGDTGTIELFDQSTGTVTGVNSHVGGAPFPLLALRRDTAGATLPDGTIYLFGGRTGVGQGTLISGADLVVRFNPRTNTIEPVNSAGLIPRHSHVAAAVQTPDGPRLYVAGGYTDTSGTSLPTNSVQEFNPTAGTWRSVAPLPQGVAQTAGCVAGGINGVESQELIHVFSGNKGSESAPSLLDGTAPPFNLQRF
jgi:hypothetical protein